MPLEPEDLKRLAVQLASLPGGTRAAIPDYFAGLMYDGLAPRTSERDIENWGLREGGILCLRVDPAWHAARLFRLAGEEELQIAVLPLSLVDIAREHGASPLVLALLCIATGQADDGRRLKIALPKVDSAARELTLMTVCRLCG